MGKKLFKKYKIKNDKHQEEQDCYIKKLEKKIKKMKKKLKDDGHPWEWK